MRASFGIILRALCNQLPWHVEFHVLRFELERDILSMPTMLAKEFLQFVIAKQINKHQLHGFINYAIQFIK